MMRIALLTTSLSRKGGGVSQVVRSLASVMVKRGYHLSVFGGKDDDTVKDILLWESLPSKTFRKWPSTGIGFMPTLPKALREAQLDLIHVHGIWQYPSIATLRWAKQAGKQYLISPHGMLDPWAIHNSAWKKRLAGLLFENSHLRGAACLHALCHSEYQAIRDFGLTNPVAVIPNGVTLPDLSQPVTKPKWDPCLSNDSRVLLFLGRIHPKKGLVNLLHSWAKIKQRSGADAWHLVIVGWEQGGHQAELKRLSIKLAIQTQVHFVGPQFDKEKAATFKRADAFILPSFSEGLPMAILEAWSYQLPVLMTPHCNIPEGFKAKAAIEMAPNPESIASALTHLFDMDEEQRNTMGQRGFQLVEQNYSWDKVGEEMASIYKWVQIGGKIPGCVIID